MAHRKTNTKIWIVTAVLTALFCGITWAASVQAADYMLRLEITDPANPTDVCPNIAGMQTTLPAGMQFDDSGNCYTPTPAEPVTPVTTDLCTNLSGLQTVLPNGYYRTSTGNCYRQPSAPSQPVDVCPNLDGLQTTVPSGYYLDTANTCVVTPEPTDECPNIPGPQATIPDGMVRKNNACYTPATTTPNTTTPTPTNTTSPALLSIPTFLRPAVMSIVSIIPDSTKQWLRSLPENSAVVVPYYIFLIVVLLALVPILQSIREALFARQISALLQRERSIAEQKNNFIALASHYLRTPLTLMNGGLDAVSEAGEIPADQLEPLRADLSNLEKKINATLTDVESNAALQDISAPPVAPAERPAWRSGWFWGPIVGSIVLTLIVNFLLVVVGEKVVSMFHNFLHLVVAAVAFVILYLGVRNLHLQRKLHAEKQLLIEYEKTIDEVKNNFISEVTSTLQGSLEHVNQHRAVLQETPSAEYFTEGYNRIESLLQKFLLLSQVQAGIDRDLEVIDIREATENVIVAHHEAISAKQLTVTNTVSPGFIRQNRMLFNFVLSSVVDNAIKFNREGGAIEISTEPNSKILVIRVADSGIGINSEKLDQLFKPFSKATSAVQFDYEGLGFSLFLDKIIMDYTGGDISAQSAENQGAAFSIATPATLNA